MPVTKRLVVRPDEFHHDMLHVGDLDMHIVSEGPEDAPLIVLLHGFPEFWYSWRHQIRPLAEAGYRVVAPDQRGYNLTSKHGPYDTFTLAADVSKLVQALGYQKAVIIGHDWGGMISWMVGALYPALVDKLIVCNCPHPMAIMQAMGNLYWPQIFKSWYVGFFQLPILPEQTMSANNYWLLANTLKKETFNIVNDEELIYFRQAWAQPGALQASINWYREWVRHYQKLREIDTTVRVPTRLIWGEPDPHLETRVAQWSSRWCPQLDIVYITGAGHFVQQTEPTQVNQRILSFLEGVTVK